MEKGFKRFPQTPRLWRWHAEKPRLYSRRRWQSSWPGRGQQYHRFGGSSPGSSFLGRWASHPHFYRHITGISLGVGGIYLYNLEEVPVSHRRRFNIISEVLEEQMASQIGNETKAQYRGRMLPELDPRHVMVQRVLDRLTPHSGISQKKWEVHVIDDPQKNAFVVPGGKVFVFTGILPICAGEDGVATVLSHEISHTVARHSAERMSQALAVGGVILALLVSFGVDPGFTRLLLDIGYSRPGSRTQESEADYLGLLMMSESCYDPRSALAFWSRMQKAEQFEQPQFMSTHPSHANRVQRMQEWLPEAVDKFRMSDCELTATWARGFKDRVGFA